MVLRKRNLALGVVGTPGAVKMNSLQTTARRQDTRFEIDQSALPDFTILVHRTAEGDGHVLETTPLDVSSTGLKLLSPEPWHSKNKSNWISHPQTMESVFPFRQKSVGFEVPKRDG